MSETFVDAPERPIRVGAVLSEAWALTSGFKGTCWAGYLVVLCVSLIASGVLAAVFGTAALGGNTIAAFVGQMIGMMAVYPFLTGTIMMGVRRAVGLPVTARLVVGYLDVLVPVALASVFITLLCTLGFMLLVIPGIYLTIGYALALPLIADRRIDAWPAMEASRRTIGRQWFRVAGVLLALGLLTALSAIPLGIGLIWTLPMGIVVVGILYRDLFGVEEDRALQRT